MIVEVTFLPECFAANVALKLLSIFVDCFQVNVEVTLLSKCFVANVALECLAVFMNSL